MRHETKYVTQPPRVTGDVNIARFLASATEQTSWRVSIAGTVHFLTDASTARRIQALSVGVGEAKSYEEAYECYAALARDEAESLSEFIAWCRRHGEQLEKLATTPDDHALKFRCTLMSSNFCQRLASSLTVLFTPWVLISVWIISILPLFYLVFHSAVAGPHVFWISVLVALLGVFVHELGHITACVRNGARQGGIGVGIYWIWPAFYADVRDSWSLDARKRLQVSLGGLYFQSIYAAILSVLAIVTGDASIVLAIQITLLLMATTLNPILKYDGYWIISDIFNITNLHTRISVHLRNLMVAGKRREICWSRYTVVTVIFAVAAISYICYVVMALGRTIMALLIEVPGAYREVFALSSGATTLSKAAVYEHAASVGLQLIFVAFALVFLGGYALRATIGFVMSSKAKL